MGMSEKNSADRQALLGRLSPMRAGFLSILDR